MKTLLILFPYSFTEFSYFKFEIFYLEKKKNYKIIIHDLSNILTKKQFNKQWKSKKEKRAIKFSSLISWIREFNKIRKKKNILIYDFINKDNFKSFVIKLFLMLSKRPILRKEAHYTELWVPKKNLRFYLSKILQHKLNLKLYLYYIKEKFFSQTPYVNPELPKTLTEEQRISPKANRLIIFNGEHWHTGQSPKEHSRRVILNLNFVFCRYFSKYSYL